MVAGEKDVENIAMEHEDDNRELHTTSVSISFFFSKVLSEIHFEEWETGFSGRSMHDANDAEMLEHAEH